MNEKFGFLAVLLGLTANWLLTPSSVAASDGELAISPTELARYLPPVTELAEVDLDKVALGAKLFHDPRLSKNNTVSCASCHRIGAGGDDDLAKSVGVSGNPSRRNSPSVTYAAYFLSQFWDGRAETLEDQIDGPIQHKDEMANDWGTIEGRLSQDKAYSEAFRKIYGDRPDEASIKDAIAEFERSLGAFNAPLDRFLEGDAAALSPEANKGAQLFVSYGCVSCHQGPLLGGNLYQRIGIYAPYPFSDEGRDLGRFEITGEEADRLMFKVPSLRNVAQTAPYFHDGSIERLDDAILAMAYYQLGLNISPDDITQIAAFLEAANDGPHEKAED